MFSFHFPSTSLYNGLLTHCFYYVTYRGSYWEWLAGCSMENLNGLENHFASLPAAEPRLRSDPTNQLMTWFHEASHHWTQTSKGCIQNGIKSIPETYWERSFQNRYNYTIEFNKFFKKLTWMHASQLPSSKFNPRLQSPIGEEIHSQQLPTRAHCITSSYRQFNFIKLRKG